WATSKTSPFCLEVIEPISKTALRALCRDGGSGYPHANHTNSCESQCAFHEHRNTAAAPGSVVIESRRHRNLDYQPESQEIALQRALWFRASGNCNRPYGRCLAAHSALCRRLVVLLDRL